MAQPLNHVIAIERELFWHDNRWSHLLIIYTDLPMDPYEVGYSSEKLTEMVTTVAQKCAEHNQGFSSISVRSANSISAQMNNVVGKTAI